jgi:ABC-type transport system involved in multi-copper enzyme maturation permease subunit
MSVLLIARNTFREAIRDRLVAGMLAAGGVLLVATQVLSPLALGEGRRLTVDLGLSGISLLGLLTVLLVGTGLVAKEIERRTIYNMLSRPIARPVYLVGKWAGLTAAIWVVAAILGLALAGLLALRGQAAHGPAVMQATVMAGLELMVVTALAVLFSSLSTPVLSSLYTLGFYAAGQWSYDLRTFAGEFPPALGTVVTVFADLMPSLPLFNMRSLAADGLTTTPGHLALAAGYAVLYCGSVLALASAAFESKDFK